jgi:phosphatidylserine/phosphatidylglycerophosphate/cardiolipin synthase-like enzyme
VDAAIYDLNLWSIRNALIDAHHRGVAVRVVVESDNLDRDEVQELIEAGIEVLGDRREGLMHHKFVVIDRYEVWTGSMNFTLNGAYHNDNHLIRIRSSHLAEDYLVEFDEMFVLDLFGATSIANTPYPGINIDGTQIEVFFSPDDGTQSRLVELIDQAEVSIHLLAFAFTADPIAEALMDADGRGIDVVGIVETSQASGTGGDFFRLADAGMDFELDGNSRNMHHKVIIIDGETVVLGSYNFSRSAEERNDENTLIIHNVDIADLFEDEFERIYEMRQ